MLFCAARCKAVGHEHVKHVGIGKSHAFFTLLIARFKLVVHNGFLLSLREHQWHIARLGITNVEVNQEVIGAIHTLDASYFHTRVGGGNIGIAYALAINHQL